MLSSLLCYNCFIIREDNAMNRLFEKIAGIFCDRTVRRERFIREVRVEYEFDLADIERRLNAPVKGLMPVRGGHAERPVRRGQPAPAREEERELPFARETESGDRPTGILAGIEGLNVEERAQAE